MNLETLIKVIKTTSISGSIDKEISGIFFDSREITDNGLFICRKGMQDDGNRFIKDAVSRGAVAIISENPFSPVQGITGIQVPDTRKAQALLSAEFYGHPEKKLYSIGITGTNGKTTTAYLIDSMLQSITNRSGLIGTIHYRYANTYLPAKRTTPESTELFSLMHEMVCSNIGYVVMEVSSHALDLERTYGIPFNSAVFTNLTPEHLDYHKNMENYFQAKKKLFDNLSKQSVAIINTDDPFGKRIFSKHKGEKISYGTTPDCTIAMSDYALFPDHSRARVQTPSGELELKIQLRGKHNLYNALAALSAGIASSCDISDCLHALRDVQTIPGRMEFIQTGAPFYVAVDYAHTEDALDNVLKAVKQLPVHKIICVFGCGGDRDKTKRARMGKVAGQQADFTIITSDNPRTENPMDIITQIEEGISLQTDKYGIIEDRYDAIHVALDSAQKGDLVLIAGKGHETTQDFGKRIVHFDDREVVIEWAEKNKHKK